MIRPALVLAISLLLPAALAADPPASAMRIVRASQILWQHDAKFPGLEFAVLEGDPSAPGKPYVIRVRFAPGAFSRPHFHPEARHIVVLQGTWWVGAGPRWDPESTTPVPAGSFVVHHARQIHFDGAKDEEVIVQISGIGPDTATAVDERGRPQP
ncbi:MAG: cupin domain-containing protein [Proteobacteria bacterium]|nr:cupin domain-containing protein [Pseudomonadota bacterium]